MSMNLLVIGATPRLMSSDPQVQCRFVATLADGLSHLENESFTAVLLDSTSGYADAARAIEQIKQAHPDTPVIAHSPALTVTEAVQLTKSGAFCCAPTGELTPIRLSALLKDVAKKASPAKLAVVPAEKPVEPWRRFLIGESEAMVQVLEIIRMIATRRSTVLIMGETGTGKEVVARAIHMASNRNHLPMVAINCGAIPDTLIEAELFGHTKGAFTGAATSRVGRFEQANGSTLFLDEIGELPLDVQAKLLRVLQEREVQRLGSTETTKIDARIVAASNIDLEQAVADRRFREDLFYRLNVVPVRLPSLRERRSDIPLLIDHLLTKICNEEQIELKTVSDEAIRHLCQYDWPGNVRQLEHVIEMAVAMSGDRPVLYSSDFRLPAPKAKPQSSHIEVPDCGIDFDKIIGQIELSLLEQALAKSNGNKGRAADLLNLKRTTFLAKLKTFGMGPAIEGLQAERGLGACA